MKYYLAGKIASHDWRHIVVPELRNHISGGCTDGFAPLQECAPLPITQTAIYVGPFFVGCDHSCFHGDGQHGQIPGFAMDFKDTKRVGAGNYPVSELELWKLNVVGNCLRWVRRCDVLIARLSDDDPSGTLVEIGYAMALGKKLVILPTSPEAEKTHWFPMFTMETLIQRAYDCDYQRFAQKVTSLICDMEEENHKSRKWASGLA